MYLLCIYTFPHLAMPGRSYSIYFFRILWNSNVLLNKILYMQIAVYIYMKCFSFHQTVDKITTKLLLEGSQFTKWSIHHYPATARGFLVNDVIYSIHVYLKAMQQFTAWWSTHLPSDKQWVSKWHLEDPVMCCTYSSLYPPLHVVYAVKHLWFLTTIYSLCTVTIYMVYPIVQIWVAIASWYSWQQDLW